MVRTIVNRIECKRDEDKEDLLQEGTLGLIEGVVSFTGRGSFTKHIKQHITLRVSTYVLHNRYEKKLKQIDPRDLYEIESSTYERF